MAFGIDDALAAAAAGISLADTVVQTIKRYQRQKIDYDIELLLGEVRTTALRRIDDADLALAQFERTLVERKVDLDKNLSDVIAATPFWQPFEQHRLSQIRRRFNEFADSIYSAGDDIAALVRCREATKEMGISVVETTKAKHDLHESVINSKSLKEAIEILRKRLAEHKSLLSS